MTRIALLFPGQASVFAPGTLDFIERHSGARALFERASAAVGHDLARPLARDGGANLSTELQQPLITAACLGIYAQFAEAGIGTPLIAGHSLGEIPAWAAAGGISAQQAVDIAVLRGRLMGREARRYSGAMAVVKAPEVTADIAEVMDFGRGHGALQIGAYNAPNEWVLTGESQALDAVARRYATVPLAVSGAWHSEHMTGALSEYRLLLESLPARPLSARLVCNRDGCEVIDPAAIPGLLANQLVEPIRWMRSLQTLARAGADTFVTIGPGKVLRSFVRKTLDRRVRVLATDTPSALARTIEVLTRE